jgi:hypothetical protein
MAAVAGSQRLVSPAGLSLSCPPLDWNHGGNANAEGVAQPVEQRTFKVIKPTKTPKNTCFLHSVLHQLPLKTPVCGCNRV